MKQPIIIQITDKVPNSTYRDNTVEILICDPKTRIPFVKFQAQRHELISALRDRRAGLASNSLDGAMTT